MSYANPEALVSTQWLEDHLEAPDVRIVDASFYLNETPDAAYEVYEQEHIPGAVFFDINKVCDSTTDLPHMVPQPEKFSSMVRKLGLGDGNRIVVYDQNGGHMAACRVWWMFRLFGHNDISVLDGGLPKWAEERRGISDLPPIPRSRHLTARHNHYLVRDKAQLLKNIETKKEQVIDARSKDRFDGTGEEPRAGLRKGHIPGSISIPFDKLMKPEEFYTFRSAEEIKATFDEAGLDLKKPITASCGSGVTACVLAFGLYLIGHEDAAVYDGSWSEWGADPDLPIATNT